MSTWVHIMEAQSAFGQGTFTPLAFDVTDLTLRGLALLA